MGRGLRIWWRRLGRVLGLADIRWETRCGRSFVRSLGMRKNFFGETMPECCGWIFGRRIGGSWWMLVWGRRGLRWWESVRLVLGMTMGRGDTFRIGGRRV